MTGCSLRSMDRPAVRIQLWGLYCFGGTWVDRLRPPPDAGALLRTGKALAACREGDTLVVTKLDRLARSLPDARAIADELTQRQVRLNLGG